MVKLVIKGAGTLNIKHDDPNMVFKFVSDDLKVRDISNEIGKRGPKKKVVEQKNG